MMLMLLRNASRLIVEMSTSSKSTLPVVGIARRRARAKEDFPAPVRPTSELLAHCKSLREGMPRTNSDTLARGNRERNILQDFWTVVGVSSAEIFDVQIPARRPVGGRFSSRRWIRFMVDLQEGTNPF
jgi:hypothetical protein